MDRGRCPSQPPVLSDRLATRCVSLRVTAALALGIAALVLNCAVAQDVALTRQPHGTPYQALFTQYGPLFSNAEILRRLLSPLAEEEVRERLAPSSTALRSYPLDLAKERFLVYVPPGPPPSPRGFALLVFVPPWDRADLPFGWGAQLNHYGVIFVTPAGAGNSAAVLARRVPLALSAEENIVREYAIDRERVYIGGFSGGSRVALLIALGYPDVFHGVLLNAGANPLGGSYPLPPRDLFLRFQSSSHLVYVTGSLDAVNLSVDANSLQSMQQLCVFNVERHETPDVDHEVMSPAAFAGALDRLLNRAPAPDPTRLDACRSRLETELQEKLNQAETLISKGNHEAVRPLLQEIDKQYGGLAGPRLLELARRCECGLARP